MKTLIVIMLLLVAGCIPTTTQINTLTNDVDKLMASVDSYQEKFAGEVDKIQEHIIVVNEAVKEKADESFVEQLEAGIEASKPFNPYADEMNAVLGLVAVIGGLFVKSKIDERNRINAKYQAHKQGAAKTMKELSAEDELKLYSNIGEARVRNKVS